MTNFSKTYLSVGNHEFQFIPPDRLKITFRGDVTGSDASAHIDFIFQHGAPYCIYDLKELTYVTQEARKFVTKVSRPYPLRRIAVVNANFATSVMVDMIMRAAKFVAPHVITFRHKFVSSIDEANVWFDESADPVVK